MRQRQKVDVHHAPGEPRRFEALRRVVAGEPVVYRLHVQAGALLFDLRADSLAELAGGGVQSFRCLGTNQAQFLGKVLNSAPERIALANGLPRSNQTIDQPKRVEVIEFAVTKVDLAASFAIVVMAPSTPPTSESVSEVRLVRAMPRP